MTDKMAIAPNAPAWFRQAWGERVADGESDLPLTRAGAERLLRNIGLTWAEAAEAVSEVVGAQSGAVRDYRGLLFAAERAVGLSRKLGRMWDDAR